MEIYLVGGAVRDELLGREVRERDWVVVGATDAQMRARGFRAKDPDFPVYLHPQTGDEYALARTETKAREGHRGFIVDARPTIALEQDLARRDLTINAMARGEDGHILAPHGGDTDVADRVLRHVTPAFVEDPLRLLRLARFHAELAGFGFRIAPQTDRLARAMSDGGELAGLSGARVWRETRKALESDHPHVYITDLARWKALGQVLPELLSSDGEAPKAGLDALARVAAAADIELAALRLAVLFAAPARTSVEASRALRTRSSSLATRLGLSRQTRDLLYCCALEGPSSSSTPAALLSWFEALDGIRQRWRVAGALSVRRALGEIDTVEHDLWLAGLDAVRGARPPPGLPINRESIHAARLLALTCALTGHEPGVGSRRTPT